MRRPRSRFALAGLAAALGVLGLTALAASAIGPALPAHPSTAITPTSLLTQRIADSTPNAAQLRRGQYLTAVGDCMSCHVRAGGEPLAGGLGLNTPFGTIYSSNITSDKDTGIGAWNPDQFHRAMHDGIGAHGENLYPAFPYPWFRRVSREDTDALFAFLQSTPAVHYTPPPNDLPFPLKFRWMVKAWNLLFLKSDTYQPVAAQSAEWNRGAYIVEGLGHCGACHTPKNMLGADKSGQDFHGGTLDNWVAPDLTGNTRTGLGQWSAEDIAAYLHAGRNARAGAGGSMADVVNYSGSLMNDADVHAVAVYLKGRPARPDEAQRTPPDAGAMRRGAAIYSDVCASCHLENGVGQPRYFPPLGHDAMLQQTDPTGLLHVLLAGSRIGTSNALPSPMTMPAFAWKLSDAEVADVSTYIRNSWGNQAAAVEATSVADMRKKLDLTQPRLTVNSGDHR
ncbi:cytochrome c [Variovorax sp. dw_308]|uniref:c-type cytochrome n=1 Tax=Variovorax sp. dw_308 TaxID=2721546 RepID=UPI001C473752|nr:cytochrome c [Variovorax sp. dw_308]